MAIFPLSSNTNIDKQIISRLDVDTLLSSMSYVNKAAATALDNECFRKLFKKKYPDLARSPYVFQVLRTFHPDKCWKVACWILAGSHRTISNFHFLSQAPLQLPNLKASYDRKIAGICGSGYEDPASPIHQAWLTKQRMEGDFQKAIRVIGNLAADYMQIINASRVNQPAFHNFIEQLNPNDAMDVLTTVRKCFEGWIREWLNGNDVPEDLSVNFLRNKLQGEKGYTILVAHNQNFLSDELLEAVCQIVKNVNQSRSIIESFRKYDRLEEKRVELTRPRDQIRGDMQALDPSNPSSSQERMRWLLQHHDLLVMDAQFPLKASAFDQSPGLSECLELIKVIRSEIDLEDSIPSLDAFKIQQLYGLIQSLSMPTRGRIWHNLYMRCANGAQEDRWSEKHFNAYLQRLEEIINDELWFRNGYSKTLEKHYQNELGTEPQDKHLEALGSLVETNYRKALLLYSGPSFDRMPFAPMSTQELVRRASFKWNLLNQLSPQPIELTSEARRELELQLRSEPIFGSDRIEILAPKPQDK